MRGIKICPVDILRIEVRSETGICSLGCVVWMSAKSKKGEFKSQKVAKLVVWLIKRYLNPWKLLIKRAWRQKIILGIHFSFSSLTVSSFFPTTLTKVPAGRRILLHVQHHQRLYSRIFWYSHISDGGEWNSSFLDSEHKPPLSDEKNFLKDLWEIHSTKPIKHRTRSNTSWETSTAARPRSETRFKKQRGVDQSLAFNKSLQIFLLFFFFLWPSF